MLKPFSFIFFVVVMLWVGSIFLTTQPQLRMERACAPVRITGTAFEAGMTLVSQEAGAQTRRVFDTGTYACKHVVWSIFYKEDWMHAKQLQQEIEGRTDVQQDEGDGGDKSTGVNARASRSAAGSTTSHQAKGQ